MFGSTLTMNVQTILSNMAPKPEKSNVQRQIDENLKRVYDDALSEDLPDKFLDLIKKLKSGEGKPDGK